MALIAAAQAANAVHGAPRFGVLAGEAAVSHASVHDHIHGVIAAIAPHDSVERLEGLGVRVIAASARFTGPTTVVAGEVEISAKRFAVATGSSPTARPIPGIT